MRCCARSTRGNQVSYGRELNERSGYKGSLFRARRRRKVGIGIRRRVTTGTCQGCAPRDEGKANEAVVKVCAEYFKVPNAVRS